MNNTTSSAAALTSTGFVPSPYHTAIDGALRASPRHLIIQAGPGSGKTPTGIRVVIPALIQLLGHGVAVAYNKKNAEDFAARLGGLSSSVTSGTIHSVCLAALNASRARRVRVEGGSKGGYCRFKKRPLPPTPIKTARLAVEVTPTEERAKHADTVALWADRVRVSALGLPGFPALTVENVAELTAMHPQELPDEFPQWVLATVERGLAERETVDFSEMIYFPLYEGVSFKGFRWWFIDEAQDVSPIMLALIRQAVRDGARIVAVGDSRQAINGFAGAMQNALDVIREELNADVLPLPVSYRCSVAAIGEANRYFPGAIEPGPRALAGSVEHMELSALDVLTLDSGDACLARTHKAILPLAMRLLRERRDFSYKGAADLVANLSRLLYRAAKKENDCGAARALLLAHHEATEQKAMETGKVPHWLAVQRENVESLTLLLAQVEAEGGTVATLKTYFNRLTEMEKGKGVTLSTFHSAKGGEWPTVYLLGALESSLAATEAEKEAERCVAFVALTRSSDRLIYVA